MKSLVECPDDEQEEPSCSPCNYSGPVDSSGLCVDPTTDLEPDLPSCECDSHFCSEVLFFFLLFQDYFESIN